QRQLPARHARARAARRPRRRPGDAVDGLDRRARLPRRGRVRAGPGMNRSSLALIPGHTLRHPTPDDADAVLAVIVARDVADLGRPDYTLEDLHADWTLPGVDPAADAWVVQEGERLVGYAFLDDRGAALISVAPDAEGRGIGTALREAAEQR